MRATAAHVPVLVTECIAGLAVRAGGHYVDGTLGLGGHARAILEASEPDGCVIGVDRDVDLIAKAREGLAAFGPRALLTHGTYADLDEIFSGAGWVHADGILLDLGVCSLHFDDAERGFSFGKNGPLDMRFDQTAGVTAEEWLATEATQDLERALEEFGEVRHAGRVARALREAARRGKLSTTRDLAGVALATMRGGRKHHPATQLFQAIRIAVNREIEAVTTFLSRMARWLAPGGRVAVIAYHSLEDRPVKQRFRSLARTGEWALITPKAVRPSREEVRRNPRARSARLRVIACKGSA